MEKGSPLPDCTRCMELEKKVAKLSLEVKRLAEILEFKTRKSKRSAAPQREHQSRKKPRELHRKSGRPKGHERASKPITEKKTVLQKSLQLKSGLQMRCYRWGHTSHRRKTHFTHTFPIIHKKEREHTDARAGDSCDALYILAKT
jgi:hypothetical protein